MVCLFPLKLTIIMNMVYYKPPSLDGYLYPQWTVGLVVVLALLPLVWIPGVFLVRYCQRGGFQVGDQAYFTWSRNAQTFCILTTRLHENLYGHV